LEDQIFHSYTYAVHSVYFSSQLGNHIEEIKQTFAQGFTEGNKPYTWTGRKYTLIFRQWIFRYIKQAHV